MNFFAENQVVHSNPLYKIFFRICPVEHQTNQKMIQIDGNNNSLILHDNTKSSQPMEFGAKKIFRENITQESVFNSLLQEGISRIIEGHNSCIISYGQTNSGKTYSIFGEDDKYSLNALGIFKERGNERQGLIPRTIEYLLKSSIDMHEIREFVITCNMFEVYLDQVRDLGRSFYEKRFASTAGRKLGAKKSLQPKQSISNFDSENLDIQENANVQAQIKNLSQITIRSMSDIYDLIKEGFELREKFDNNDNRLWFRAHTVFNVTLVQKDRENENLPFLNATIQFVDLAGSERISKALTEGYKFQDSVIINNSMSTLGKCLFLIAQASAKRMPYKESKLTRVMQNYLTSQASVILLAHLNSDEKYYDECLSTLQFVEKTRSLDMRGKFVSLTSIDESPSKHNDPTDKYVKKLKEQLAEARTAIDSTIKENKQKFADLQKILGFETDLEKLVMRSSTEKEIKNFKAQREALFQIDNYKNRKKDLEIKLSRLEKQLGEFKRESHLKVEKSNQQVLELKEQIKRSNDVIAAQNTNFKEQQAIYNDEKESKVDGLRNKMDILLDEKYKILSNVPIEQLQPQTQTILKNKYPLHSLNYSKKVPKPDYNTYKSKVQSEIEIVLNKLKDQFGYFIEEKVKEGKQLEEKMMVYREKHSKKKNLLRQEILDVYTVVRKQQQMIESIEMGKYSNGKKMLKFSAQDVPKLPERAKFKHLFAALDKEQISKDDTLKRSINEMKKSFKQIPAKTLSHFFNEKNKKEENNNGNGNWKNEDDQDDKVDVDVSKLDLEMNIESMDIDTLKNYAKVLKNALRIAITSEKTQRDKLNSYKEKNINIDVFNIIKEKNEYSKLLEKEILKSKQIVATIESQKRLINHSPLMTRNKSSLAILETAKRPKSSYVSGSSRK